MATEHVSVAEAAEFLGRDRSTVQRWIQKGKIPAERISGIWLIRRIDLEAVA